MIKTSIKLFFALAVICMVYACGENGNKGTQMTSDGFAYQIHTSSDGLKPAPGDYAYFEMDILDDKGEVLQSMRNLDQMPVIQIPTQEDAAKMPNPIVEILAQMAIGDSATLVIPMDSIPAEAMADKNFKEIRYELLLKDIKNQEGYDNQMAEERQKMESQKAALQARVGDVAQLVVTTLADYKSGALKDQVVTDESGLEYVIHEEGTGPIAQVGENVSAHYYGVLKSDGSKFDTSFDRGMPFTFTLGQRAAIDGWDVAFQKLPSGTKATLFVPYNMAYGESGRPPLIPAKSDLVFYVEVQ